jgi:hypothetical protein
MKNSVFWDITQCSSLKANRRFGGTFRFHFMALRARQVKLCLSLLHAGFLLGLLVNPDDGGNMFL